MIQSKNLKLKLGLCGLALTSFLALNAHSTVHADTVNGDNAGAITWDSDQDDSQVVKEDSQQVNASQSAQTQGAVQSVPATQSVQSNVQKRAEKSAVRVSNFDTSTVNRNNAQNARNNANVKVATVYDTSQMPVQKQKVAQFNQGSKIYTLNGSTQLSKNNGDGYIITNAGTYNGRAVDIGVTINNVQNNQGTYTTKWSNGDKADVTGKTDASFKYQDSVLLNQQQDNVTVPNQTRSRPENKEVTANSVDHTFYVGWNPFQDNINSSAYAISPKLLTDVMTYYDVDSYKAADMILKAYAKPEDDIDGLKAGYVNYNSTSDPLYRAYSALTDELITNVNNFRNGNIHGDIDGLVQHTQKEWNGLADAIDSYASYMKLSNNGNTLTDHNWLTLVNAIGSQRDEPDFSGYGSGRNYIGVLSEKDNKFDPQIISGDTNKYLVFNQINVLGSEYQDPEYGTKWHLSKEAQDIFNGTNKYTIVKPVQVTDHLQLANKTDANLNYNYTVGLYDAQTGELITDLKPEYKSKAGVAATTRDSVMNSAIKNKIQQINQGKATVSYTGTSANDDVAFYQETRQVNPQSTDVNRKAQRVIHVTFPNGKKPASYDGIVDENNDIVQTVTFTRTGTENVVSGQKTYGPWQQHGGFSAVTLPSIPGYTMTTTGV